LGRDVFSRVVLGAGEIVRLAGLGTLLAALAGTALGLLSGYAGGLADEALMRLFDALLAMPALLLALLLLGTLGASENSVLLVIVVVYTPIVARVVRSVVLPVKTRGYVEAARLQGESLGRILFREILPAALPALAVEAALRFSYAIFLVASLGFLGIGVQPPSPNWGLMVSEARDRVTQTPWALYYPAGAISLLVIGVNLFADGLRRVLQMHE
jgi:peptide/nickel transport system permease protein